MFTYLTVQEAVKHRDEKPLHNQNTIIVRKTDLLIMIIKKINTIDARFNTRGNFIRIRMAPEDRLEVRGL